MDRSGFLNSLIDERSFPWTRIFTDLEKAIPPGVRVITLTPRLVDGRAEVSMQVGVVSAESEIQFLQAMEKSKAFSGSHGGSGSPCGRGLARRTGSF